MFARTVHPTFVETVQHAVAIFTKVRCAITHVRRHNFMRETDLSRPVPEVVDELETVFKVYSRRRHLEESRNVDAASHRDSLVSGLEKTR